MDFGFSAEQEQIRATARKFFENECKSEFVRARMAEPAGVTDEFWKKLGEQGWLGLVYPEEFGGTGLGFVDLTVLMEEMGRAVMPGPFLSTLLPTMDQTRKLCEVKLKDTPAALLGAKDGGWAPLERVAQRATVALCAEMCGGAQKVLDMTTEYAKIRIAFGKPIGSYQGVKHRAADMLVDVENAKSLTYYAAWAVDESVPEAALACSMAKAYTSDAYRKVAGAGIQLHGGIGFTWEHDLHLYFKRAKSSEFTFGDATYHREKVAQLISL